MRRHLAIPAKIVPAGTKYLQIDTFFLIAA